MNTMISPLLLSLKIATIATFIAFVIGVLLSSWFAYRKNKWTEWLSIVIMIPLVIPPTVLGYYLLIILGRNSAIGQMFEQLFGQPIVFTWQAAVIAAAISALPLLIRPIQVSFEGVSRDMRGAAQLDGANWLQLFWYLILPLSYRGVLAGVVLGFARAMGEFGATLMVAGNIPGQTQTLSIAIYDAVQADRMRDAHLMVIVLTLVTIVILYVIHKGLNGGKDDV